MSKPRPVRVVSGAREEIDEACSWWKENRPSAPTALEEDLRKAFEFISSFPRAGSLARNVKLPGVRRVLLDRVRYHMYYRVIENPEGEEVEVLAFWHSSRGSGPNL